MLTNSQNKIKSKIIFNKDERNAVYNPSISQVSELIQQKGIEDVSLSEDSDRTTITFRIKNSSLTLKVQRNKNDGTLPIFINKQRVWIYNYSTWTVWNSLIDDVISKKASISSVNRTKDEKFLDSIRPTLNEVFSFYLKGKCIVKHLQSDTTVESPTYPSAEALLNKSETKSTTTTVKPSRLCEPKF